MAYDPEGVFNPSTVPTEQWVSNGSGAYAELSSGAELDPWAAFVAERIGAPRDVLKHAHETVVGTVVEAAELPDQEVPIVQQSKVPSLDDPIEPPLFAPWDVPGTDSTKQEAVSDMPTESTSETESTAESPEAQETGPKVLIALPPPLFVTSLPNRPKSDAEAVIVRAVASNTVESSAQGSGEEHVSQADEQFSSSGENANIEASEPDAIEQQNAGADTTETDGPDDIIEVHVVPQADPESSASGPVSARDSEATRRKLAHAANASRNAVQRTANAIGKYAASWWTANKVFASETTYIRPRMNPERPDPQLKNIKKIGAYAVYGAKSLGSFNGFVARNTPLAARRAARFSALPAVNMGLYYALTQAQGKGLLHQTFDALMGGLTALTFSAVNKRRESNTTHSGALRSIGAAAIAKAMPRRKNYTTVTTEPLQVVTPDYVPARVADQEETMPEGEVIEIDRVEELVPSN